LFESKEKQWKRFLQFSKNGSWSLYKLKSESCEEVMSKEKVYYGKNIEIMFNSEVCIHSGICVKGLPEVFDLSKRPWVNPDADTTEAISRHIDTCPSGALTYKRLDGEYSTEKEE
jgi:uncharacterized Fe-S cluster protein YjdI